MKEKLFSIITVTRNAETTLPTTLRSVAAQECRDFEYIVIDGASTDDTVDLARKSGIDDLHILSEPDRGLYDAMNKGLAMATGTYVIFLNAGDAFHAPDTLARLKAAATEDGRQPDVIYGQTAIVDASGCFLAERHLIAPEVLSADSFADGMVVCHQAFVARRALAPLFDTSFRFSADYDWCIKILERSRLNRYVDATIIDYLAAGLTTANRRRSLVERFRIMAAHYGTARAIGNHLRFVPRFIKRLRLEKKTFNQ